MSGLGELRFAERGETDPRRRVARARLWVVLRYAGSAVALLLLFRFLPGRQMLQALEKLPAQVWLLVLAGYLATHLLGVGKWRLMVNTAGAGLTYLQAGQCYFAGLFGSLFLPSLIGGDLVRAGLAMRYGKTNAGVLLGSVLDRVIDLAGLMVLAASGALLLPSVLHSEDRRVSWGIGAGIVAITAVAAVVAKVLPFRRFSMRVRRRVVSLRRAGRSMMHRPRASVAALGIALIAQLLFINLNIVLADACGLRLGFRAWLFAWPLAKLSAAIPVTQGGIGVREATLAAVLVPFGAAPALAVAAGLAWEAVSISGALVSGAFALAAARMAAPASPQE